MDSVHIEALVGTGDCDDCGCYTYGHFSIAFSDGTTLRGNHDGHLGGGNWDGSLGALYLWALAKLGYTLSVNNQLFMPSDYRERAPEGTWPQWLEVPLFEDKTKTINLVSEPLPAPPDSNGYYDSESTTKITVPSFSGGEPKVFRPVPEGAEGANWDGDLEHVWRAVLEQLCVLTVDYTEEPYEPDSYYDDDYNEGPGPDEEGDEA